MAANPDIGEIPFNPEPFHLYGGTSAIEAMLIKQQLLKAGRLAEASQYKIGVLFEGGGHAVSNEVGAGIVLFERGMFDGVIDVAVGASGGAIVMKYSATGDRRGLELFRINCENGFADLKGNAIHSRGQWFVKFSPLHAAMEEHDTDGLFKNVTTELFSGLINAKTRGFELHDLKRHPHVARLLAASSLMPFVGDKKTIEIDGQEYFDGSLRGLPAEEIAERYGLTHMLILKSQPIEVSQKARGIGDRLYTLGHAPIVRRFSSASEGLAAFHNGRLASERSVGMLWTSDVGVSVHAPTTDKVGVLTMEYSLIEEAAELSGVSLEGHFVRAEQELAKQPALVDQQQAS